MANDSLGAECNVNGIDLDDECNSIRCVSHKSKIAEARVKKQLNDVSRSVTKQYNDTLRDSFEYINSIADQDYRYSQHYASLPSTDPPPTEFRTECVDGRIKWAPAPGSSSPGGDQSWRDNNPGAVLTEVSPGCVTPRTFDPSVTYDGPSNDDNYYNYCYEMILLQSSECKEEVCADNNVYGACRGQCDTGVVMDYVSVSPGCVAPKTFDPTVTYDGPKNDNYYNYCYEMVLSQSSECKKELCADNNVYGACRNECGPNKP